MSAFDQWFRVYHPFQSHSWIPCWISSRSLFYHSCSSTQYFYSRNKVIIWKCKSDHQTVWFKISQLFSFLLRTKKKKVIHKDVPVQCDMLMFRPQNDFFSSHTDNPDEIFWVFAVSVPSTWNNFSTDPCIMCLLLYQNLKLNVISSENKFL